MRDVFNQLQKIEDRANPTIEDIIEFVSIFSGVEYNDLLNADIRDLKRAYNGGLESFNTYKKQAPPDSIQLNGQWYDRIKFEEGRVTGGWYIDVKNYQKEFEARPALFAALNYVERGLKYADKDKDGFAVNKLSDREKVFNEHFQPDVFLNLHGFFLSHSEQLKSDFLKFKAAQMIAVTKTARKQSKKLKKKKKTKTWFLNGLKRYITLPKK